MLGGIWNANVFNSKSGAEKTLISSVTNRRTKAIEPETSLRTLPIRPKCLTRSFSRRCGMKRGKYLATKAESIKTLIVM
jgi:hypothetical protein